MPQPPAKKGRASGFNTPNRFEQLHLEPDPLELDDEDYKEKVPTQFFVDSSKSILAQNNSPDVGFRFSLNPYRGCEHGCVYCYARPTHEHLGFSAGLDFETRILVKENAPELLRETQKVVETAGRRPVRQHRLLSARRTPSRNHPPLPAGLPRVP